MFNPTKRNRNIGTAKQGHGYDNRLEIPSSWHDSHIYCEKLGSYTAVTRNVNGKEYTFLVEKTRTSSFHCCTIDDIARVLGHVPDSDLDELHLFVLRQPKRKEEILEPVWGRLQFYAKISKRFQGPCIMLDAVDLSRSMYWSDRKLNSVQTKNYNRLIEEGHVLIETKKNIYLQPTIETCRNTQLYRTLLHEIGHYVQYMAHVFRPARNEEEYISLKEQYRHIPNLDREVFADTYADSKRQELTRDGVIPFDRIIDLELMRSEKLNVDDFLDCIPQ